MKQIPVRISRFSTNAIDDPLDVGLQGLIRAQNINLDRHGHISARPGKTKILDGKIAGWGEGATALLLDSAGSLTQLESDFTETVLGTVTGYTLCGTTVNGTIYFSDGVKSYVLPFREVGVPLPNYISLTRGDGGLPQGRYLITATNVIGDGAGSINGRESGSLPLHSIDVPPNSSITIAVNAANTPRIYMSSVNGKTAHYIGDGNLTVSFLPEMSLEPVDREYIRPFPGVEIMEEHGGYLFGSVGSELYMSEPLEYEQYNALTGVYQLDGPITMIKSVETGLFISAKNTYFATLQDGLSLQQVYEYPAIKDTAATVPMSKIGEGGGGNGVLFNTTQGICLGTADGGVNNITERKVTINAIEQVGFYNGNHYIVAAK